ncbi:MAG TPA: ABC transporter permease subunit [Jatrophihabitans sp.]|jgi:ABC-2 type transport system permease protein|uniref:ABC transporter permease subunit n=1 Tax=Jatrophihabitans sp. TaxID=1932789 RepID=UPI002DFE6AC5|nr:ABC transporter permease subunit [Jatrophihabitans sp.]
MPAETVLLRHLGRRAVRSAVPWGVAFGLVVLSSGVSYLSAYPHVADRQALQLSLGGNVGLAAIFGPVRSLADVGGFTAWRALGLLTIVGGIWGVLAGARLMRGEEEAGRWEVLLASATTRRRAAAAGVAAGGLALVALGLATLAGALLGVPATGLRVGSCVFLAATLVAPAAVFLAITLLLAQFVPTRRVAAQYGALAFGVAYVVRLVALATGRDWLARFTPLGWVDAARPMTGSHLAPLLAAYALAIAAGVAAAGVAGRRDLGAAAWARSDRATGATRLLGGPGRFAARQALPQILGWVVGIAAFTAVFGLVSGSVADATLRSHAMNGLLDRLGAPGAGTRAFLGLGMLTMSSAIALAAAAWVSGIREAESAGLVDVVLVQPVSRRRWLAGRVAVAAAGLVALGLATGVALIASVTSDARVAVADLVAAGLNAVPIALVVIGGGVLTLGVLPRATAAVAYGLVAFSFLDEMIGAMVDAPSWVLDLSLLHHLALAPDVAPDWSTNAVLVAIGLAAALAGGLAFTRRDLVTA